MPECGVMLSEKEDEMWQVKNAAHGTHTSGLGGLLLISVLIIGSTPGVSHARHPKYETIEASAMGKVPSLGGWSKSR